MSVDSGALVPVWTFGDRIRKARACAKMDQRQFAEAIGTKPGSIATWETDRARPRDVVTIAKRIELLTRIPAAWTLGVDAPDAPDAPDGGDGGPMGAPAPTADKSS